MIATFAYAIATGNSNYENALRHFMLAGLMSLSIGQARARKMLRAHEPERMKDWDGDSWRDWNNNYAGFDAANLMRAEASRPWHRGPLNSWRIGQMKSGFAVWRRHGRLWCRKNKREAKLCNPG